MATKIRLARHGSHKRPFYWLVVAESAAPRDGRYIEKLGVFNPFLPKDHPERINFKTERVEHWLKTGAKPTERSEKLLNVAGIKVVGSKLKERIEKRKAVIDAKKASEAAEAKAKEEAEKAEQESQATEEKAEAPTEKIETEHKEANSQAKEILDNEGGRDPDVQLQVEEAEDKGDAGNNK